MAKRKTTTAKKPKTGKKAAASAAAAKPVSKSKLPPVKIKHLTNRYAPDGHPKNSPATRTTEKRYNVMDAIMSGKSTLGSIQSDYGFTGLRNVARHARFGRIKIRGIVADAGAKLDGKADRKLAEKLATMGASVKIESVNDMTRLCS